MPHNFAARLLIVAALSVALAKPADAETFDTLGKQITAAIVVVAVGVAVGITFLILHEKHRTSAITGCVASGAGGTTVTDERDKRVYTVSGNPPGIKPGDRMTLEGKRKNSGNTPLFEARSVTKDLGLCHP